MTYDPTLDAYQLSDRYDRQDGSVFLTGTQDILRIALDQARRDRAKGLKTTGFRKQITAVEQYAEQQKILGPACR